MISACKFVVEGDAGTLYGNYNTHHFQIVEKVPSNFFVWNIGKNMATEDYIPMCVSQYSGDDGILEINPDRLYAIRLPRNEVLLLREAGHRGVENLAAAEKALAGSDERKKEIARKTIDIFRKIQG